MAERPVLVWPDARLTQPSAPIAEEDFDSEDLHALAQDLVDTMHANQAEGLSAVQIGDLRRVIALPIFAKAGQDGIREGAAVVVCNPFIETRAGSMLEHDENQRRLIAKGETRAKCVDPRLLLEGCLSFPGMVERLDAPMLVVLKGRSVDGKEIVLPLRGYQARAACHEVDHIDGRLMIDRMGVAKRRDVLRRWSQGRTLRKAG